MTMTVYGLSQGSSEDYRNKANLYFALQAAGYPIPQELVDYFGGEQPHIEDGQEVEIPTTPWSSGTSTGVEMYLASVPNGIVTLRFIVTP